MAGPGRYNSALLIPILVFFSSEFWFDSNQADVSSKDLLRNIAERLAVVIHFPPELVNLTVELWGKVKIGLTFTTANQC